MNRSYNDALHHRRLFHYLVLFSLDDDTEQIVPECRIWHYDFAVLVYTDRARESASRGLVSDLQLCVIRQRPATDKISRQRWHSRIAAGAQPPYAVQPAVAWVSPVRCPDRLYPMKKSTFSDFSDGHIDTEQRSRPETISRIAITRMNTEWLSSAHGDFCQDQH